MHGCGCEQAELVESNAWLWLIANRLSRRQTGSHVLLLTNCALTTPGMESDHWLIPCKLKQQPGKQNPGLSLRSVKGQGFKIKSHCRFMLGILRLSPRNTAIYAER